MILWISKLEADKSRPYKNLYVSTNISSSIKTFLYTTPENSTAAKKVIWLS